MVLIYSFFTETMNTEAVMGVCVFLFGDAL